MLRNVFIAVVVCAAATDPMSAQDKYPVAVGLGAGIQGGLFQSHHGMALVTVTPPHWPIAFRLDGLAAKSGEHAPLKSALSASAVIALRPWRVAPYLVVGSSRTNTGAFSYQSLSGGTTWRPSVQSTELTGGFGLSARFRSGTAFMEMRSLGQVGTPISIGFTF